ncbi:unnamed protein product [Lepeophtheirus salmonis]|uniref:(salmon louse) hypothetical protein n=1 Tax=Lepeophtheirus salmonis TaxID=72036 RepID=A0A7R8H1X3_LEPSM|nr:unnamed protein product [Lepeophtheirus salmonis]CAF2815439.1 unnamed protein product [Lepeophtheirus salmonis]
MSKLNISINDSKLGLNKSLTRLPSSQHYVPFHSSCTAHSAGSINNRISLHCNNGTASPTKSMSSGSVSIVAQQLLVKVNISQINQDLIRQVSSVQSCKNLEQLQPHLKSDIYHTVNSSENHHITFPLQLSQGNMPCHNSGSICIPSRQLYFGVSYPSTSVSNQPTSSLTSSKSITPDVSSIIKIVSNFIPQKFVFDSVSSDSSEHEHGVNFKAMN